jgi:hypothetical protein
MLAILYQYIQSWQKWVRFDPHNRVPSNAGNTDANPYCNTTRGGGIESQGHI